MSASRPYIIDEKGSDVDLPTLTEFGYIWAYANRGDSPVAQVALQGYSSTWPVTHVQAAIDACNRKGAETAGL